MSTNLDRQEAAVRPQGAQSDDEKQALREAAFNFDIKRLEPSFLANPYPTYRALREHAPVHKCRTARISSPATTIATGLSRYGRRGARTRQSISGPNFAESSLYEHHTTSLVFNDPPIHSRVRKLLAPAFTPRALKALEPRIEALVDRLLDDAGRARHAST